MVLSPRQKPKNIGHSNAKPQMAVPSKGNPANLPTAVGNCSDGYVMRLSAGDLSIHPPKKFPLVVNF
jgi:hypothetical protein